MMELSKRAIGYIQILVRKQEGGSLRAHVSGQIREGEKTDARVVWTAAAAEFVHYVADEIGCEYEDLLEVLKESVFQTRDA